MFDVISEIVGYTTARVLLPILSFGKLRVQRIRSDEWGFNWLGFRREPDGSFLVGSSMAGWLGLFLWLAVLVLTTILAM